MARMLTKTLVILGIAALVSLASPLIAYANPGLLGADHAKVVLTGSMEPNISPGDIVFIEAVDIETVEVGDVITYKPHPTEDRTYTHRVVEKTIDERGTRGVVLTTQGDANEDPDPQQTNQETLVGRVSHTVPVYGQLVFLLDSRLVPLGLVVLSILTIGFEVSSLLADEEEDPEPRRFQLATQDRSAASAGQPPNRFEVVGR